MVHNNQIILLPPLNTEVDDLSQDAQFVKNTKYQTKNQNQLYPDITDRPWQEV